MSQPGTELMGWCPDCNRMVPYPHLGQALPRWFLPPCGTIDTVELRRAYDRCCHQMAAEHAEGKNTMDDWFTDTDLRKP